MMVQEPSVALLVLVRERIVSIRCSMEVPLFPHTQVTANDPLFSSRDLSAFVLYAMNMSVIANINIGKWVGCILIRVTKTGNRRDLPTCSHRHACEAAPFPFPVQQRLPL